MAEDPNLRREFISRIGTFFIVVSVFALILFAASDISRNNPAIQAGVTQTYIVLSVQAIQTRDSAATMVAPLGLPTPTLMPVPQPGGSNIIAYLPAFCIGAIGLMVGWFLKRISAPPSKPNTRFEGIRKFQEKQREAKAARDAALAKKNAAKKK